jgi:hypothetical protein
MPTNQRKRNAMKQAMPLAGPWIDGPKGKQICELCHQPRTPDGDDPCIGGLPGVANACCGHGREPGYLIFANGVTLQFRIEDAARITGSTPTLRKLAALPWSAARDKKIQASLARGGKLTNVPLVAAGKRRKPRQTKTPGEGRAREGVAHPYTL